MKTQAQDKPAVEVWLHTSLLRSVFPLLPLRMQSRTQNESCSLLGTHEQFTSIIQLMYMVITYVFNDILF